MEIRKTVEADLPEIVALERQIFSSPWSEKSFRSAYGQEHNIYLTAIEHDRVMGYCGLWCSPPDADLCNMAVAQDCRQRGIGKELLSEAFRYCLQKQVKYILLEVRVSNVPAQRLYQSLGFEEIGIRKGYYSNPAEDALLYQCCLIKDE